MGFLELWLDVSLFHVVVRIYCFYQICFSPNTNSVYKVSSWPPEHVIDDIALPRREVCVPVNCCQ